MKFLSPDLVLYLFKSTFQRMEVCCEVYGHGSGNVDLFTGNKNFILVWTSVSKHYRYLPDRYQKRVCEAAGPAFADLPKPLAYHCEIRLCFESAYSSSVRAVRTEHLKRYVHVFI